jgi:hypothetical protein
MRQCARWGTATSRRRLTQENRKCGRDMPNQHDLDRRNDTRFLTPLLVMALILAIGVLLYAYGGHSLAATG